MCGKNSWAAKETKNRLRKRVGTSSNVTIESEGGCQNSQGIRESVDGKDTSERSHKSNAGRKEANPRAPHFRLPP